MTFIVFIMSMSLGFSADTLNIVSPSYFNENNNVYEKINYLENEILSFEFCSDKELDSLVFKIIPDSGKDLDLKIFENKKKKNCHFTNFALEKIKSDEFSLEIIYSSDNKEKIIKRKFQKQKQSKLINHVLGLDPDVLNPVDLSYFLIVLNDVESSQSEQSVNAYEKLKVDRNNNNKCWPKDSCDILDTSLILRNLVLSGYSLNSRLIEDGQNYLNKFKISNENNPTRFDIEVDNSFVTGEEVTCSLKIDNEDEVNYKFDKDSEKISKFASDKIILSCNESMEEIKLLTYTYNGKLKETVEYDNSRGFTVSIDEFSCIGKSSNCDYSATIDTLIGYGGSIKDSNLLSNYIDSLVIKDEDLGIQYLDTTEEYEDTGKYLFYKSNAELTNNLKFNQNNDGSWGKSSIYKDLIKTAWSVLGLQKVGGGTEYIDDGKKWIYFKEPSTGWGDIEKNTLAYLAIKEQIKPYLKINEVNEIKEVTKFKISNPTIHNLKNVRVELSPELNKYVSYSQSLGDLEGKDEIEFNIKVDADFFSELSGRIIIKGVTGKNADLTLIDMPINLVGPSPISLVSGNYSITEEVPVINLRFMKNVPTFDISCDYTNPFEGGVEVVTLTQTSYDIPISNFVLKQGNFDIEFDCKFGENVFSTVANVSIDIAKVTFKTVDKIVLNSLDDFSIVLNDTSSERQTINFEIGGTYKGIIEPAEATKLIAIDDSRDIFFKIKNPILLEALGNSSVGDLTIISDSGYKKRIPMVLDLSQVTESEGLSWWVWLLIILGFGFVGLVAFRFYEMKAHEKQSSESESMDDDFYFE